MAVGFAAGWGVFERPWESKPKPATAASIQDATARALGPRVRDVSCEAAHGRFYSCVVYTSEDGGASYAITVASDGRCLHAGLPSTPTLSRREAMLARRAARMSGGGGGFRTDVALPT